MKTENSLEIKQLKMFMTKVALQSSGGRRVDPFNTQCLVKWISYGKQINLDLCLRLYQKLNSRRTVGLTVKKQKTKKKSIF